MCDLDEARDRKEDGFDEEVQEEECDSKTAEKAMPPGTFIGFKECCLGTLGPPVTQNPEGSKVRVLLQGARVPDSQTTRGARRNLVMMQGAFHHRC